MQVVSAAFTTASLSATQQIASYLEVAWNDAVTVAVTDARGATGWTNETAYLKKHSGELRINPPGDSLVPSSETGKLTLVMHNDTLRYSWQNAASPLYAYIGGAVGPTGKPVRLWQGFVLSGVATYVCIFTGIIARWQPSTDDAVVTLECLDWGYRFLQDKRSSAITQNVLPSTYIAALAATVGISATAIDTGLFRIPFCWMDDESVVDEIWQTAEADGGVVYFDQCGKLRFENALHWTSAVHTTPALTIDEGDYTISDPELNMDQIATKIIVEWSGRYIGAEKVLYALDAPKVIMPLETETWTARFDSSAAIIATPSNASPYNDYSAQTAGGADITNRLTLTLTETNAQQATISVYNASATQAARLTVLKIRGLPLVGGPTEQEEALAPVAPYSFQRVRSVRGNIYVQTLIQGRALAATLALRGQCVRPVYKLRGVLGIPQLELGDCLAFRDVYAQGSGNVKQGVTIGITWEGSSDAGFMQELMLMDTSSLSQYGADYFIIGTSALGNSKRAYY